MVLYSSFISSYKVVQVKNMSIKEGLDHAQNLDVEASNQIDGSGRIANQIDVHQVTSGRSGLADRARHISRSDGNIGEEHLHTVLLEDQFADVYRSRPIAADVNDEGESLESAKQKSKPPQWWVQYQLDGLLKKRSSYNKKIIRKSSTIEGMMYSPKNIEAVRD